MPEPRRRSPSRARLAAVTAAALLLACGERPAEWAHRGPLVLITLDALRADAVGALGGPPRLTPALDGLAREATWAGRAIAPSSWTVPSMGSLFTGLQPWRNENRHGDAAALPSGERTLSEVLQGLGFATSGFFSGPWLKRPYGYHRGFDTFRYFGEGRRVEARLETLGRREAGRPAAGPRARGELVWAHVLPPHAPYRLREALVDRLQPPVPALPPRVVALDLDPYFDPAAPLPPEQERIFRTMYQLNVAWADQVVSRLLAALKKSGQWDDTLLVITSDHGEEFKECGQVEHGGNLCRSLIEVPLLIKLPKGWQGPPLALRRGERPGTVRLRATLIEAAGGVAEPHTAPSLFHRVEQGVLSELYMGNGVNRFSLVEGDRQLVWESAFAPPEPDYYRVHTLELGGRPAVAPRISPEALHAKLRSAFAKTMPLSGREGGQPSLALWRWAPAAPGAPPMTSPVVAIEDRAAALAMARRLKAAWVASNGPETPPGECGGEGPQLTPEEKAEIQALGYAAARRRPC